MRKANTPTKPPTKTTTLEQIAARPLTKRQRDRIAILVDLPDEQIDTSDIPEITATSGWVRNPLYRPITRSITIRLNAPDIVVARTLSKKKGMPYQTFIRQLLHDALEREVAQTPFPPA
jgi:predicted DNA binding CopG/RHH family protein